MSKRVCKTINLILTAHYKINEICVSNEFYLLIRQVILLSDPLGCLCAIKWISELLECLCSFFLDCLSVHTADYITEYIYERTE